MPKDYPTYHLTDQSFEKLEKLADSFLEKGLDQFQQEFASIDEFVEFASGDPRDRDDHELRITPKPKYLLELLNFAVYDRINREAFNQTKETLIILPDCLSLHNRECEKSDRAYGDICRNCVDSCQTSQIVQLAVKYRAKAIFSKRKLSEQLKHYADRSENLGVVGIACVMMLANGMRTADEIGLPTRGVLLNGCGCEHWNDTVFASGVSIKRVQAILEEKYGT
ncbi:MAG: DUF116 domain-containing protein [bacterium]|nr:DUF116 domain-containing protein [bacterium]